AGTVGDKTLLIVALKSCIEAHGAVNAVRRRAQNARLCKRAIAPADTSIERRRYGAPASIEIEELAQAGISCRINQIGEHGAWYNVRSFALVDIATQAKAASVDALRHAAGIGGSKMHCLLTAVVMETYTGQTIKMHKTVRIGCHARCLQTELLQFLCLNH